MWYLTTEPLYASFWQPTIIYDIGRVPINITGV